MTRKTNVKHKIKIVFLSSTSTTASLDDNDIGDCGSDIKIDDDNNDNKVAMKIAEMSMTIATALEIAKKMINSTVIGIAMKVVNLSM